MIGVSLAAPFILDLEHGTYRLAWTQSITRRSWLAAKLGLPLLVASLAGGALIVLFDFWRGPQSHIDGRLEPSVYDSTGVVILGYALFGLGLTVAVGAVWRRTATSLAVGLAGYFALRLFVNYKLRDHLVSPLTATWKGNTQVSFLDNADVMRLTATNHGRTVLSGINGFFGDAKSFVYPGSGLSHAVFHAVYQPPSHYWPLQLTETALFTGLALLLIAFAAWRVLRAD